jgi:hypothetical protein
MESVLDYFNDRLGTEEMFEFPIGNESLHDINNDIGIKVVNFATSKIPTEKYNVPTSQQS